MIVRRFGKFKLEEKVEESCWGEYVPILRLCKYFVIGNNKSAEAGPLNQKLVNNNTFYNNILPNVAIWSDFKEYSRAEIDALEVLAKLVS